jgi:2-polyprenyl-3-methyl-5-hydroxy-6-metoxy-1,4-benzoquinol methylase
MQVSCNSDFFNRLYEAIYDPSLPDRIGDFFFDYYQSLVTNKKALDYFFRSRQNLCKSLSSEDKEIIEIGCGFGLNLICLVLLGAKKAVGIDISEEMINGFNVLLEYFPELDIEPVLGDFLLTEYEEQSYDVVILNETISHVRDTELLLDKVQFILRPQGKLFIQDENNEAFFPSRFARRRLWKIAEYGPILENKAQHGRAVDRLPFFQARQEIIRANFPSLADDQIILFAKKTQGLYGETLIQACTELQATGKTFQRASFPYRNPYTGEFQELGINPFKLTKELIMRGFRCRYLPPPYNYLGSPSHLPPHKNLALKVSRIAFKGPNVIFPLLSHSFYIVATKY